MTVDRLRGWVVPLVAACLVGVTALPASGQTVVTGKVTNTFGVPIPGTTVMISSLKVGGTANDSGVYSITIASDLARGQTVTATAKFIGYAPMSQTLTLSGGAHQLDFALKADPFQLNAVITTGVADSTSAKNLTFSAAKVTAAQIQTVPASDALTALTGKVAGVMVSPGTGTPGGTPTIRLRGSTCLSANSCNGPLIIIDGVITTESIADLNVSNIASMEIVKGAAGASFYGSNGANGVINITTKSGKSLAENHVSITAHGEYGQNSISHWPAFNSGTRDTFNPTTGAIILDASNNPVRSTSPFDDTPYPTFGPNAYRDQMKLWTKGNDFYNSDVSMGLRRGNTNFNTSYSSDHNGGLVPFRTGQFRQNVRLNIDQGIGDKLDLSTSMTYGNQNLSNGGNWFALYQAPPIIDLRHPPNPGNDTTSFYPILPAWADPNSRGNPLYSLLNEAIVNENQRILGNFTMRYRPTTWLSMDGSYGADHSAFNGHDLQNRGYYNTAGAETPGYLQYSTNKDFSTNIQLNATAQHDFWGLASTTRLTYLAEQDDYQAFNTTGRKFNVGDTPTLNAIDPTTLTATSSFTTIRANDFYITQGFNYKDRYLAQIVGRRDGSSLFGTDARWKNFFGLSGAWRVTEDFHIPGFQELKLRYAVGTAGLRPNFADQYQTYNVNAGVLSKNTLGNPDLQPAVQRETEGGINATFLNRFDAEIVSSERRTTGAFLSVPLSVPLNGGFSSQVQNAATVAGKTLEGSLNTRVIQGSDLQYNFTLTASRTRQHIDHLGSPPFQVGSSSQGQAIFYYRQGEDLGVIYGTRFDTQVSQLLDNPANAGKSLDSLKSIYSVNDLGYVVKTASIGLPSEAPVAYVDKTGNAIVKIMEGTPDFNWGLANTVHYKGLTFYGLLDGVHGGQVYDFSKQWMFQDLRSGDIDQSGKPAGSKHAYDLYTNGFYNALDADSYFVEPGGYVKLRELSVSYDLGNRFLSQIGLGHAVRGAKISLIGRNLKTWTKYTGMDPEAASNNDPNLRLDGFRYPTFRQVAGQIQLDF